MKRQKKLLPRNRCADPCPWSAALELPLLHLQRFTKLTRLYSKICILCISYSMSSSLHLHIAGWSFKTSQAGIGSHQPPQTWLIVATGLQYTRTILVPRGKSSAESILWAHHWSASSAFSTSFKSLLSRIVASIGWKLAFGPDQKKMSGYCTFKSPSLAQRSWSPPCQTLEPHHMWSVATPAVSTVSWSLAAPCIMATTCAQRNPICHTVHDMIEQMGKVGSRVREGNSLHSDPYAIAAN